MMCIINAGTIAAHQKYAEKSRFYILKMNSFGNLVVAVVLCQFASLAVGNPNVISFADFMEFDVGLNKACEDNPGGENGTWTLINKFTECSQKLKDTLPTDVFDNFATICANKDKYLQCWETTKAEALEKCGKDKAPLLPAVYRATVETFCGTDNGAKKIDELRTASVDVKADDTVCPESQTHWVEQCQDTVDLMNSPDLCIRHAALDKCLGKITCDKVKFASILRGIYKDARKGLNCP